MNDMKTALKKFLPVLKEAKEKNLNEADTRMRIRLMLERVLGFDILEDITQEHMVSSHYVDMTVKYKGQIRYFIEAKSVDTTLRDTHIYQATNYAAKGGVKLCVLTNGIDYKVYNIDWKDSKVEHQLIFEFNLLNDPIDIVAPKLWMLSKDSLKKGAVDKYIAEVSSLSDRNLLQALMTPRIINAIRGEVKALTGNTVSPDAVERAIKKLFSDELYNMVNECFKKPAPKPKTTPMQPQVTTPEVVQ